jgi:peptide deformylase
MNHAMRIVHYPHPALKHPAAPVKAIDKDLRLQIGRMFELMYDAKGLGLAAPQVALPYQLLVMNVTGKPGESSAERVYLNPVVVERKGVMDGDEGCLSFPGLWAPVKRAKKVVVEAFDENGAPVRLEAAGLEARAWQHEIDHLNGVVFIERFSPLVRTARDRDVKVFERRYRQAQEAGVIPPDADIEKLIADLEQAMA